MTLPFGLHTERGDVVAPSDSLVSIIERQFDVKTEKCSVELGQICISKLSMQKDMLLESQRLEMDGTAIILSPMFICVSVASGEAFPASITPEKVCTVLRLKKLMVKHTPLDNDDFHWYFLCASDTRNACPPEFDIGKTKLRVCGRTPNFASESSANSAIFIIFYRGLGVESLSSSSIVSDLWIPHVTFHCAGKAKNSVETIFSCCECFSCSGAPTWRTVLGVLRAQ